MAKLSTQFMGMELKNPVLAAPGPWTGTAEGLQAAIDAGAGAVMTETISQEVYPRLPQTCYHEGGAVFSTSLYSNLTLEQWEAQVQAAIALAPGPARGLDIGRHVRLQHAGQQHAKQKHDSRLLRPDDTARPRQFRHLQRQRVHRARCAGIGQFDVHAP